MNIAKQHFASFLKGIMKKIKDIFRLEEIEIEEIIDQKGRKIFRRIKRDRSIS